jgi:hypothetical protein
MKKSAIFERSINAENPMRSGELAACESLLARLVAQAFAADHPELFGRKGRDVPIISSRAEN